MYNERLMLEAAALELQRQLQQVCLAVGLGGLLFRHEPGEPTVHAYGPMRADTECTPSFTLTASWERLHGTTPAQGGAVPLQGRVVWALAGYMGGDPVPHVGQWPLLHVPAAVAAALGWYVARYAEAVARSPEAYGLVGFYGKMHDFLQSTAPADEA